MGVGGQFLASLSLCLDAPTRIPLPSLKRKCKKQLPCRDRRQTRRIKGRRKRRTIFDNGPTTQNRGSVGPSLARPLWSASSASAIIKNPSLIVSIQAGLLRLTVLIFLIRARDVSLRLHRCPSAKIREKGTAHLLSLSLQ